MDFFPLLNYTEYLITSSDPSTQSIPAPYDGFVCVDFKQVGTETIDIKGDFNTLSVVEEQFPIFYFKVGEPGVSNVCFIQEGQNINFTRTDEGGGSDHIVRIRVYKSVSNQ